MYAFWLDESVNPRSADALDTIVNQMTGLEGTADTRLIREELKRREIGHGRVLVFLHLPCYRGRSVGISVAKRSLTDLPTLHQMEQIKLY
ncbi:hypothetical protein D3C76_1182160 [compost metagenome]